MKENFWNRRIIGIAYFELAWVVLLYSFSALLYYLTLEFNIANQGAVNISLHSFKAQAVDYLLKFLLTIPIWLFIFRGLKHFMLYQRLLIHLITLPIFVLLWQQLYYYCANIFGYYHLRGSGQVWDIYIPGLFYVLQFSIFHAYEYYYDNQKKQKLEAELREAALRSELSALKAQINPHFLYNVFNTINALIPKEQERTRMVIAELSDLFRYQLMASKRDTVSLREELDFVRKYLNLEKERFQERLNIYVDADKTLLDRHVPPMILQPLVENCVKHGISSLIEGGTISIKIKNKEGMLHFEVADTGIGVKDKAMLFDKGIGLTNTKIRLEKMYGSILKIEDNNPRGLKVSFSI